MILKLQDGQRGEIQSAKERERKREQRASIRRGHDLCRETSALVSALQYTENKNDLFFPL